MKSFTETFPENDGLWMPHRGKVQHDAAHQRMLRQLVGCMSLIAAILLSGARSSGAQQEASPQKFTIGIEEQAGIARQAEPVKVSLPFAAGVLSEPTVWIEDAAGKPVESQFEVLARWSDGSIRWLLARFFVDLAAGQQTKLTVRRAAACAVAGGKLLARKQGDKIQFDTGALRAEVGPDAVDSFLVTDRAGRALLAGRPTLVIYTADGVHRALLPDKVELEVNGSLYACAFVSGPMAPQQGKQIFRYETRLHFWRGKAQILAEHTMVSVAGPKVTIVDGVVVELATGQELSQYVLGGESMEHGGQFKVQEKVRLQQNCAYWQELSGVTPIVLEKDFSYQIRADGAVAANGQKSPGWLWVTAARASFGVAVRDFWEEGPKALTISQDGKIRVELYAHWKPKPGQQRPKREPTPDFGAHPKLKHWFAAEEGSAGLTWKGGRRAQVVAGELVKRFLADTKWEGPVRRGPMRFGRTRAKTTDVHYVFGSREQEQVHKAVLAARRSYLVPVVDPEYFCGTRAMNFVWSPAKSSGLPRIEKGLLDAFRAWQRVTPVYGFIRFGCGQCGIGYNKTVPSTSDVQEYDTTRCLTAQYARTGLADYFRWAQRTARHYADVDQDQLSGNVRYHGYRGGGDYHEEPKSTDMGGHIYIEGIVDHYALTGDRRSLRAFQRVAGALSRQATGATVRHFVQGFSKVRERLLTVDERSTSKPAVALLNIYDLTRDPKHLDQAKEIVEGFNAIAGDVLKEFQGQPPFRTWWLYHGDFWYHVQDLLVRYHNATGDESTLATLMKTVDLRLRDSWDSQREGWCIFNNQPFSPPIRKFPDRWPYSTEFGLSFAYAARMTGDMGYLAPFLDELAENDGLEPSQSWEKMCGNRRFTRSQWLFVPFISLLPRDWRASRDRIVLQEVFRASLKKDDGLRAWRPEGEIEPTIHGQMQWTNSPFGQVVRTHEQNWVSYKAPKDILAFPGTVSFWVSRGEATWGRKPWPWYTELRGLLHIADAGTQTNALDLMCLGNPVKLWTRLYDQRGWDTVVLPAPFPWNDDKWHHVAVVWNRFSVTVYVDGDQAAVQENSVLPSGGQKTIHIGYRPGNWYGQASFYDLRLFRSALPPRHIKKIYDQKLPQK